MYLTANDATIRLGSTGIDNETRNGGGANILQRTVIGGSQHTIYRGHYARLEQIKHFEIDEIGQESAQYLIDGDIYLANKQNMFNWTFQNIVLSVPPTCSRIKVSQQQLFHNFMIGNKAAQY